MRALRVTSRSLFALPIIATAVSLGCVGEASVSYQGTVTEGAASGHSFDDAPNPACAPAIAGATVELCIDGCRGLRPVTTAADGSFPEIRGDFSRFPRR